MDTNLIKHDIETWLDWALKGGGGQMMNDYPPVWALAIVDRHEFHEEMFWLDWARGAIDDVKATMVSLRTESSSDGATPPDWARDLLWARWLRGAASDADVLASLGLEPDTDLAEAAPEFDRKRYDGCSLTP